MSSHHIAGFQSASGLVNATAFQTAYASMAQLKGVKVEGSTDSVTKRLEELTEIVGTLAEGLSQAMPAVNLGTSNAEALASIIVSIEDHLNIVETKVDWTEHQRNVEQNAGKGGTQWTPKAACESKAMMSIKSLGSDKTGFRLWNQKFVNAVTQVHPGPEGYSKHSK